VGAIYGQSPRGFYGNFYVLILLHNLIHLGLTFLFYLFCLFF
jgi:hypothetical protein